MSSPADQRGALEPAQIIAAIRCLQPSTRLDGDRDPALDYVPNDLGTLAGLVDASLFLQTAGRRSAIDAAARAHAHVFAGPAEQIMALAGHLRVTTQALSRMTDTDLLSIAVTALDAVAGLMSAQLTRMRTTTTAGAEEGPLITMAATALAQAALSCADLMTTPQIGEIPW